MKVRGRPETGDKAKRHSVSLRVTPAVMSKLDARIAETGRSLAHELEILVETALCLTGGNLFGEQERAMIAQIARDQFRMLHENFKGPDERP